MLVSLVLAVALQGCQTTHDGNSHRVSHSAYTASFDQGAHLRQLLSIDEYIEAIWLYEEQIAFFSIEANRQEYDASLRALADHYNNPRRQSAYTIVNKLQSIEWPVPPEQWRSIRDNIEATDEFVHDYPSDILLEDKTYGLDDLRKARALHAALNARLIHDLQTTFDGYDHFGRRSFFLTYPHRALKDEAPEDLDSVSLIILKERFPNFRFDSLAEMLAQARKSDLSAFAKHHPNSEFLPNKVQSAYLQGLARHQAIALERSGLPAPASRLLTAAAIRENGYIKDLRSTGIHVLTTRQEPATAQSGRFPIIIQDNIGGGTTRTPTQGEKRALKPRNGQTATIRPEHFRASEARYVAIVGRADGYITETSLDTSAVSSQRPVKTDRRVNPKWTDANSTFDDVDKVYQDAGGDAEYHNLPRDTSVPDHAYYNVCGNADALSCAVGTLIGAAIVSGIDHYRKEKREKILKLYTKWRAAKLTLDSIKKEFVTHTYGPYEFTRRNYHVRKYTRVKTLIADLQSSGYSVLEFTRSDDRSVTVLEGFSDLDKDREAHTVNAMTETEYDRYRTAVLEIPLSQIIATFEHEAVAHGQFKNLEDLAKLSSELFADTASMHSPVGVRPR